MRSMFTYSFLILALASSATAQAGAPASPDPLFLADSLRQEIDVAAQAFDRSRLEAAKRYLDRATTLFPNDGLLLHYRAYAASLLVLFAGDSNVSSATKDTLRKEALDDFAASARLLPLAESHALRWVMLAQTITDQASASAVMPEMASELAAALRLGKKNPRVWLLQGIIAYYAPEMAGGGLTVALDALTKAQALFATDHPAKGMPAWGQPDVYVWLGLVHAKLGHNEESQKAYSEALRTAPSPLWIKQVLVPALASEKAPY